MRTFSEEIVSGAGILRVDVVGGPEREHLLDESTFLAYRLAAVEFRPMKAKERAEVLWNADSDTKSICYTNGQLILHGAWEQGELNKIIVSMLAGNKRNVSR